MKSEHGADTKVACTSICMPLYVTLSALAFGTASCNACRRCWGSEACARPSANKIQHNRQHTMPPTVLARATAALQNQDLEQVSYLTADALRCCCWSPHDCVITCSETGISWSWSAGTSVHATANPEQVGMQDLGKEAE